MSFLVFLWEIKAFLISYSIVWSWTVPYSALYSALSNQLKYWKFYLGKDEPPNFSLTYKDLLCFCWSWFFIIPWMPNQIIKWKLSKPITDGSILKNEYKWHTKWSRVYLTTLGVYGDLTECCLHANGSSTK